MIEDTPVITTSDGGTSKEEDFKGALVQPLHQKQDIYFAESQVDSFEN